MKTLSLILKILLSAFLVFLTYFSFIFLVVLYANISFIPFLVFPPLIPLIWLKRKKAFLFSYLSIILVLAIIFSVKLYNNSKTINVTPNINTSEYLPFREDSKIVKIKSKTLSFKCLSKEELPIIDGATAAFPVYSAFVNAVYPETTELYDGVFEYNNTTHGYRALALKETDLFIGAYPSKEQLAFAKQNGTEFEFTKIGSEAFVFFVHKDNPIENLTLDQIKGIYSGKITNWKEVGGPNEKIVPFQRNKDSGSQSMLIRLMGSTPIIEPDKKTRSDGMGGIIEEVADYKSKPTSIGFSFRFYLEGMIKNPDIKMISIDGVAPSKENIKNGSYPIIAPVYAVTYKDNPNENVQTLIDWIVSEEGQFIIEETGYVGLN